MSKWWYALHVETGKEDKVRKDILRKTKIESLEAVIGRVIVAREEVIVYRAGKRQVHKKKLFPGYICVQLNPTDDTFHLLSGIRGLLGPIPNELSACLSDDEVWSLLEREAGLTRGPDQRVIRLKFDVNDQVTVRGGTFDGVEARVKKITGPPSEPVVVLDMIVFGKQVELPVPYHRCVKVPG